jgi:NADH-quinone oxidoreductase subunit J
MSTHIWFFLLVLSAFCFILTQNTIYATLWLIFIYVITSILFINLNISYLGFIFLMVYVGAIAILFLFVVMMLPLKHLEKENSIYLTFGMFFLFMFFFLFFFFSSQWMHLFSSLSLITNTSIDLSTLHSSNLFFFFQKIGYILFSYYYLYLFVVGLVLLIAMIGAIYITNEQSGIVIKKQELQLTRISFFRKGTY